MTKGMDSPQEGWLMGDAKRSYGRRGVTLAGRRAWDPHGPLHDITEEEQ